MGEAEKQPDQAPSEHELERATKALSWLVALPYYTPEYARSDAAKLLNLRNAQRTGLLAESSAATNSASYLTSPNK